jgi:O-antigen/teichoic acid export membrane protein
MGSAFLRSGSQRLGRLLAGQGLRAGVWALADQILISASNLATTVLLARALGPSEFGVFAVAYTVLLLGNSLQSALVTQPHNVLAATRQGEDYVRYTTATAIGQATFTVVVVFLILAMAAISAAVDYGRPFLLVAVAATSATWQAQEFARRVLYTEGRLRDAFWNDLISYGGQPLLIVFLSRGDRLHDTTALYAIAATSAAAAALGGWRLRSSMARHGDLSALRENWRFGKWLAGGEIALWFSSQIYIYVSALILGPTGVGVLRAVQTIFGPMRLIVFALNTILPIQFARALAKEGTPGLHARLKQAHLFVGLAVGCYAVSVALLAGRLMGAFFGDDYAGHGLELALYAGFIALMFPELIIGAALKAKRLTRHIFFGHAIASLIAILFGWVLVATLGVVGAVIGMGLAGVVRTYLFWRAYQQSELSDVRPAD